MVPDENNEVKLATHYLCQYLPNVIFICGSYIMNETRQFIYDSKIRQLINYHKFCAHWVFIPSI